MDYGKVLGGSGLGGGAIAVLPNTGGSRSVITYVAWASVAIGAAVLISGVIRLVAKHRSNA